MSNTGKLEKDFVTTLKEQATKFNSWVATSTALLNAKSNFNKATNDIKNVDDSLTNLNNSRIRAVNTIDVDLAKEGIDVSEWEDSVKPVKAIASIMTKDNGENISIEIGNLVMLMEDGTFRMNQ